MFAIGVLLTVIVFLLLGSTELLIVLPMQVGNHFESEYLHNQEVEGAQVVGTWASVSPLSDLAAGSVRIGSPTPLPLFDQRAVCVEKKWSVG